MRFKDIFEAPDKYPWGDTGGFNPNRRRHAPQIGGKNVNPIKKTDVPVDPVKGGSVYDQEKALQKQQNLTGAGRKGKLPASAIPGSSGEPGLSPAERGINPKNNPTSPAMKKVNDALKNVDWNKLDPKARQSLINKINSTIKTFAKSTKNIPVVGKKLSGLALIASAGLELLDPSIAQAANEARKSILGTKVKLNEVQYILSDVQGFTVTLANPEDPRQTTQLNLSDKKVDMSGAGGMISITDELSPAERTNMLRRAKGAMVDVSVSNLR